MVVSVMWSGFGSAEVCFWQRRDPLLGRASGLGLVGLVGLGGLVGSVELVVLVGDSSWRSASANDDLLLGLASWLGFGLVGLVGFVGSVGLGGLCRGHCTG